MARSHGVALAAAYFDAEYGRDETKLEMWKNLCRDMGVRVGPSITQCKKALKGIYINIHDFVAARKNRTPVRRFPSHAALRDYIQSNPKKRFPLREAKGNPMLRWMLVQVY